MKNKLLLSAMFLLLLVGLYTPASYSQTPATYSVAVSNPTISTDGKVFEFDIYLLNTSGTPFELYAFQGGLMYDNLVKNGGVCVATWVPNSQLDMNVGQRAATLNMTTAGVIKIAPKIASGFGTGTVISTVAPGTKYGRLRITNPQQFLHDSLKLVYSWTSTPYATIVSAYDQTSTVIVPITAQGTFSITSPLIVLPVELSSFASTNQGRTVVLNWSTKTEKNSDRFEVERSLASGSNWTTIASVKAAVLSNSPKNYSYSDTKLQSGKYNYRLKMVDNNGTFEYSKVEVSEVAIPKEFAVSQNYPNPFNPSTKIDYQVPVDAKVVMEVYNIAGQRVFELVNQDQTAGYYTVDFGASKLSSGVYIYRIIASDKATGNNFSSIKKMMLLK
jgi:hypothetical protein